MKTSKICTKCKLTKELTEFHKQKNAKDGHKSACKSCNIKSAREYVKSNLEKTKIYKANYYQENKEELNEISRNYVLENLEKTKIYKAKHYQENRTEHNSRSRIYQKEHRLEIAIKRKEYYQENKTVFYEKMKAYRKTENGKISMSNYAHKRREQKFNTSDGTVPMGRVYPLTKELQELLESQNHKCNYCECDISDGANLRHLDHIQPLSKGGTHSIDNVQWLCATCNLQKSDKVA